MRSRMTEREIDKIHCFHFDILEILSHYRTACVDIHTLHCIVAHDLKVLLWYYCSPDKRECSVLLYIIYFRRLFICSTLLRPRNSSDISRKESNSLILYWIVAVCALNTKDDLAIIWHSRIILRFLWDSARGLILFGLLFKQPHSMHIAVRQRQPRMLPILCGIQPQSTKLSNKSKENSYSLDFSWLWRRVHT